MTVLQQDASPGPAMSTVSSISSDRYITPEYLAHLPTSVSSHLSILQCINPPRQYTDCLGEEQCSQRFASLNK